MYYKTILCYTRVHLSTWLASPSHDGNQQDKNQDNNDDFSSAPSEPKTELGNNTENGIKQKTTRLTVNPEEELPSGEIKEEVPCRDPPDTATGMYACVIYVHTQQHRM